jgi:hypothetical protein
VKDGWRPFDKIEATFRPGVKRTLRSQAEPLIGQRLRLYCAWPIQIEDGGDYVGQHAWLLSDRALIPASADPGWIPTEDLADIVVLSRVT